MEYIYELNIVLLWYSKSQISNIKNLL